MKVYLFKVYLKLMQNKGREELVELNLVNVILNVL